MAKTSAPVRAIYPTDAEIAAARAAGRSRAQEEARAAEARYDAERDTVVIELDSGATLSIPRALLQGLENATAEQLATVEILSAGGTLLWDTPDVAFSIDGLARGVFGSRPWMSALGREGGSRSTERKAAAARANGAKGGRPKKPAPAAPKKRIRRRKSPA